MGIFEAIVFGLIQGLTEFLPISSSAHLRIAGDLFGWGDPGAAFTAVIQIGTELAIVVFLWNDIWRIVRAWFLSLGRAEYRSSHDARMGWMVIVGSIPIAVLGVIFKHDIETGARNLYLIATTLIVLGLVLWAADAFARNRKEIVELGWRDAVLYGLAQAGALVPGVSRSGATISMGLALGYDRAAAARYSFLLAIPSVFGAGFFEMSDITSLGGDDVVPTLIATVVSFVVGYLTVRWFLHFISTHNFRPFVFYRIALGVLVFVLLGAGVLSPR